MFGLYRRNQDGTRELLVRTGDYRGALAYADALNQETEDATYFVAETENPSVSPGEHE